MLKAQAGVVVDIEVAVLLAPHQDHHTEGPQVHQGIGQQIVEEADGAQLVGGDQGHHQVAAWAMEE